MACCVAGVGDFSCLDILSKPMQLQLAARHSELAKDTRLGSDVLGLLKLEASAKITLEECKWNPIQGEAVHLYLDAYCRRGFSGLILGNLGEDLFLALAHWTRATTGGNGSAMSDALNFQQFLPIWKKRLVQSMWGKSKDPEPMLLSLGGLALLSKEFPEGNEFVAKKCLPLHSASVQFALSTLSQMSYEQLLGDPFIAEVVDSVFWEVLGGIVRGDAPDSMIMALFSIIKEKYIGTRVQLHALWNHFYSLKSSADLARLNEFYLQDELDPNVKTRDIRPKKYWFNKQIFLGKDPNIRDGPVFCNSKYQ